MKFIQHILSKGLIIAIAILAALGFHFRSDLFPQWFAASAPEEKSTQQSQPMDTAPMEVPPAPPPVAVVPAAPVQNIPAAPLETSPAPLLESAPVQSVPLAPPRFRPEDVPESALDIPQESSSQPSNQPSNDSAAVVTPAAEATASAASAASIDAARAAFWSQDFSQAEQLYQQLASADSTAADPLGELGNLYYTQGRWNDAAEAYAGAATRLAAVGDIPRARHLLRVLDGLDPARAKAVWESISAGGG